MAVIEDISERKRIELDLQRKSAILLTITLVLNIYLDNRRSRVVVLNAVASRRPVSAKAFSLFHVALQRAPASSSHLNSCSPVHRMPGLAIFPAALTFPHAQ
jgi:hypothetical protein